MKLTRAMRHAVWAAGFRLSEARGWVRLAELYPTEGALLAAIDALMGPSGDVPTIPELIAYGRRPGPRPELHGARQMGWLS